MRRPSGKTVVLTVLILLCTAFIFSNSLKNGEMSNADSAVIVEIVEKIADAICPGNTRDWNYIVRKGAHLFEFCVLGILVMHFACLWRKKRGIAVISAVLYVVLVASADELIQRFTGRTSRLADVGIDVAGACIGFGLALAVERLAARRRKRKKASQGESDPS